MPSGERGSTSARRSPDLAEFLGEDEVLETTPMPWSRWRATWVVAAGVAAVAAVVALGTQTGRQHQSQPSRAPTGAPARHVPEDLPGLDMGTVVALHSSPERCPVTISCFSGPLPAAFLKAVHEHLPTAIVQSKSAVTQTNPRRVYFRALRAIDGPVTIVVRVTRSNILDGLGSAEHAARSASGSAAFVRVVTRGYEVEVQFSAPPEWDPPLITMRALAHDPALIGLA